MKGLVRTLWAVGAWICIGMSSIALWGSDRLKRMARYCDERARS